MAGEVVPIYLAKGTLGSDYAARRKQQALDLGCSEEYAEELRLKVIEQVKAGLDAPTRKWRTD